MSDIIQAMTMEKEYEKNPDISPEDIKKLREWLKTQPHLPEKYISDLDIMLAFFCCAQSTEFSKQLLDQHYTVRTHFANLLKYREVNKAILSILNVVLFAPLPTLTLNNYKAVYCRILDGDLKRFIFNDTARSFIMTLDLLQLEDGTWPGFAVVIDMDMVTLGHLAKIDIATLREGLYFFQECVLLKLKEIHFINAPSFMDKLLMIIKPFTNKSLIDLFVIHEQGSNTLYKYVSKDSMPKESGGKYKDYETLRDEQLRLIENNREYFKEENLRRVNESLRPNGKKITEDFLGVQGSFKKLDID